jgi:bifunctional non-homologous end joining protein LigD
MADRKRELPMPRYIEPMRATLVREAFDDPDWLFETKWDGFRVEALVGGGVADLWTRGQQDASRYFGRFLDPATWIDARTAIVDGEVVAFDPHGEPDFALLQQRIRQRADPSGDHRVVYEVFDLLELDGVSLLERPLEERKRLLREVLRDDPRVRFSDHVIETGIAAYEAAKARGLEGVMAKDRRSPYLPGRRSDTWRKFKVRPEQELIVGGWTRGTGYATDLAALLVGVNEDGELRYVGKVGAGFDIASKAELLSALAPLEADRSPFAKVPAFRGKDITWVEPRLVVRAEFAGWTGDGNVRQASYKGLDRGKDPRAVIRERPADPT